MLVSATNGKTTSTAMVAEILRPANAPRAQQLGRESRLGRRLRPPPRERRPARPLRGRRGGAARGGAARSGRGRSSSAISSATSSTATGSSSSSRPAGGRRSPRCPAPSSSLNGDDPQVGDLARRSPRQGLRRRRSEAGAPGSATRGRLEVLPALRHAVRLRRRLRRPPRRLPVPALRSRAPAARRDGPRDRAARPRGRGVHARGGRGIGARGACASRSLQRLQRARSRVARAFASEPRSTRSSPACGGSPLPSDASSGSRSAIAVC